MCGGIVLPKIMSFYMLLFSDIYSKYITKLEFICIIGLCTGRNAGRGKVAYNWISPDPAKAGPTLGGVVVVVVVEFICIVYFVGIMEI